MILEVPAKYVTFVRKMRHQEVSLEVEEFRKNHFENMEDDVDYRKEILQSRKYNFNKADTNLTGILNEEEWKHFN